MTAEAPETLRVDKWLWHARFLKSRSLAAKLVTDGKLRINGDRHTKPGRTIRPEDVLTFTLNDRIRVIRIIALGTRRGPAPEAQALYEDMSPPEEEKTPQASIKREPYRQRDRKPDKPRYNSA